MNFLSCYCLLLVSICEFVPKFILGMRMENAADAAMYLMKYGYVRDLKPTMSGTLSSLSDMKYGISRFQQMANIPITGRLDSKTIEMMKKPRCGVPDMVGTYNSPIKRRRRRRYTLQGSMWMTSELGYRLNNFPTQTALSKTQVEKTIDRAFQEWQKHTVLKFKPKANGTFAEIDVHFAKGEHGDAYPFDGPNFELGHAFFPDAENDPPNIAGDVHFDDDENWYLANKSLGNVNGSWDLLYVAIHEIGHSLGLDHSDEEGSLMQPFYQFVPNATLHVDDINAIQNLYGAPLPPLPTLPPAKTSRPPVPTLPSRPPVPTLPKSTTTSATTTKNTTTKSTTTTTMTSKNRPNICGDPKIDAITHIIDGKDYLGRPITNTYVFKEDYIWQLDEVKGAIGVKKISERWNGINGPIDAALFMGNDWRHNGATFIFKGSLCWKLVHGKVAYGYPKEIRRVFRTGKLQDIDAAFKWSGNGKIYFIKGRQYFKAFGRLRFPKPLSLWSPKFKQIDAAFQYKNNRRTYFFTKEKYYRYDDLYWQEDRFAYPAYPRQTSKWWFRCYLNNERLTQEKTDVKDNQWHMVNGNKVSMNLRLPREPCDSQEERPSSKSAIWKSSITINFCITMLFYLLQAHLFDVCRPTCRLLNCE